MVLCGVDFVDGVGHVLEIAFRPQDVHPERRTEFGDALADCTDADDADGLAVEFPGADALPDRPALLADAFGEAAFEHEHVPEHLFCNRLGVNPRRVRQDDFALLERLERVAVDAGTERVDPPQVLSVLE